MALNLISPPVVEPVSLSEIKDFLKVDQTDNSQDNVLMSLIMAARGWCEAFTAKRFVQQTWQLLIDFFPGYIDLKLAGSKVSSPFVSGSNAVLVGIRYAIMLPYPPCASVDSFTYLNANGQVTSMITGPVAIASVSNIAEQPVQIVTEEPHNLQSGASVTIAGNAPLLALLGQASELVTILDEYTLVLLGTVGTGAAIAGGGTATGYNYIQDVQSNPARLTPVFGQVWPVARVVVNAVQVTFTCGYAIPIVVSAADESDPSQISVSGYTFLATDVGRPICIPGAAVNGGTLNTVIASVAGSTAELRDPTDIQVTGVTALLVNNPACTPSQWENLKTGIKLLVNHWYENRVPDETNIPMSVKAVLWPSRDFRL